jgi:polyhydroxybutyrate depolymerase
MLKPSRIEMKSAIGLLVLGVLACGQSGGSGGKGGSGSGGAISGGAPGSGGAVGSGGIAASGGAKGTGGVQGSGGTAGASALGTGGTVAATGGTGTAGTSAAGGNGGNHGSGGTTTVATGGRSGSGGILGTGGASVVTATGGATSTVPDAGTVHGSGGAAGGNSTAATGGAGGSAGTTCPGGAKPADGKKTITVGTTSRTYYLHIPTAYDGTKPAPLVVDFHGLGGSGTSEASSNPYRSVIDPEGVVSAYPDGVNGTNGTGWNLGPCCTTTDDVAFAKALVQDVEKLACIDPKRVYAVGFSLGGGMVHVLACKAADVFAAVSPAAADLVQQNVDSCAPARPITVFTFRGTADTAVPYGGGSISGLTNIGAQATFQTWAKIDQCTGSASAADANGCSTYASCTGGVQVTLCTKQGGGHEAGTATVSWPVLKKYTLP